AAATRVGPDRLRLCRRRQRQRRADPHCENCPERLALFIHMNAPNCYCAREKKAADAALFPLSVRVQITGISKSRPQTLAKPPFRQADATETRARIAPHVAESQRKKR